MTRNNVKKSPKAFLVFQISFFSFLFVFILGQIPILKSQYRNELCPKQKYYEMNEGILLIKDHIWYSESEWREDEYDVKIELNIKK